MLRTPPRPRVALALLAGAVVALGGCSEDAPQNTLKPEGQMARDIKNVLVAPGLIAVAIGVGVYVALIYIAVRFRRRHDDEVPKQIHGSTPIEIAWTVAPAVLMAVTGVFSVQAVNRVYAEPSDPYNVTLIGHQWWWEQRYPMPGKDTLVSRLGEVPDPADVAAAEEENRTPRMLANQVIEDDPVIVNANELVIPAGRNVRLTVGSHDVMHNYWVPKLNGKIYAIPGKLNKLTLMTDPDDAGKTFYGQCAEFCGISHANMRFKVKVLAPADFDSWIARQAQAVADPEEGSLAAKGMAQFAANCSSCHYVDPSKPTEAAGKIGPNLAHIGSREHFAGAIAPLTPQYLKQWLDNPQKFKPGSKMIIGQLSDQQIDELIAYIQHLK